MNEDLLKAILSMDAYNRGYDAKLELDPSNAQVGTAVVGDNSEILGPEYVDDTVSFFAQAYAVNGQTIISYRGTDSFNIFTGDPATAWPIAVVDDYSVSQALFAARFFQTIVGNGSIIGLDYSDLASSNISFTGHSSGGGLAGLMAAIYGQEASIFDSMAFEGAAEDLVWNGYSDDPTLYEFFFLDGAPTDPIFTDIQSYLVEGEAVDLSVFAAGAEFQAPGQPMDLGFEGILDSFDRHSSALLVIRMYADETPGVGNDWLDASQYVLPKLFDDNLAEALGLVSGGATGTASASDKMMMKIAYSAIDEGTTLYGNTAIRALYNDMNELGQLVSSNDTVTYLKEQSLVLEPIGEVIAQYSGLLAQNMVTFTGPSNMDTGLEKGALYYDESGHRLIVDFSRALWQLTEGPKAGQEADIIGKLAFVGNVATFADPDSALDIAAAIIDKWNDDPSHITQFLAATTDSATALDGMAEAQARPDIDAQAGDGFMLVGAGGGDTLTGWTGDDLVIAGAGIDTIVGGIGNDLLFGGGGNDTFKGYDDHSVNTGHEGSDLIVGGEGTDTVDYSVVGLSDYSVGDQGIVVEVGNSGPALSGQLPIIVSNDGSGSQDLLYSIEKIVGTEFADSFNFAFLPSSGAELTIDVNGSSAQSDGRLDIINVTSIAGGAVVKVDGAGEGTITAKSGPGLVQLKGLDSDVEIHGTGQGDEIIIKSESRQIIYAGGGDDVIDVASRASSPDVEDWSQIYLDDGNDTLKGAGLGTVVHGGAGDDTIYLTDGILFADAEADDVISFFGRVALTGGIRWVFSESAFAHHVSGLFKFGMSVAQELIIEDFLGRRMGIANYVGGPGADHNDAGIYVGEFDTGVQRMSDPGSLGQAIMDTWRFFFGDYMKANFGESYWSEVDPLVLDLDGDGLELIAQTAVSPSFDMDDDGYLERTGWVRGDDGLLAFDANDNGTVDGIGELFGGAGESGFAALEELDTNDDGIIDANDAEFTSLRVWQDLNGNGISDPGELMTLTEAGIVSISLNATPLTDTWNADNQITAEGTFTRSDGTTGQVADVSFRVDNMRTEWAVTVTHVTESA